MATELKVIPFESPYAEPPYYPRPHSHPRIWVTPASIGRVRADLTHPDHEAAYRDLLSLSEEPISGEKAYFSEHRMSVLRAKAYRSLICGEPSYGKDAVRGTFHELKTMCVPPELHDSCRAYGSVMYTAACVYDWCFDLLTPDERYEIVALCENELGPHFEVGYPPLGQGNITGHGCEAQVLRDWLSLGIAAFDEHPDIYRLIAGRIFQDIVPGHDYYYRSRSHWQGSAYGPYRYRFDLTAEALFFTMSEGKQHLYTPEMGEVARTFLYYYRPDGQCFRVGDDFADKGKTAYGDDTYYSDAFLAGNLYRDPIVRGFAYRKSVPFSPEIVLSIDDPSVGKAPLDGLPKYRYCGSPHGAYFARTGLSENDTAVYMKIGESYSANHEQKDAGDFMIFHRGSLVSASNCYEYTPKTGPELRYGSRLDLLYNKQTVSHNCMLVYDPDEDCDWGNCGGQRSDRRSNGENRDLADWESKTTFHWAKVLGHAAAEDGAGNLRYVYLDGDLENAYSDKVEAYRRAMLAVATGDGKRPLLFFVSDRIVTKKPDFKKTFLLHCTEEPRVEGNRSVITAKAGGRLICETLLPKRATLTVVGGEDNRFVVNGENIAPSRDPERFPLREDGWGRVEVSPADPAKEDRFLHAMLVTEEGDGAEDLPFKLLESENAVGAVIGNTVAVFPKAAEGFSSSVSLTLPASDTPYTVFVTGLCGDGWQGKDVLSIETDGALAVCRAKSGEFLLHV